METLVSSQSEAVGDGRPGQVRRLCQPHSPGGGRPQEDLQQQQGGGGGGGEQ